MAIRIRTVDGIRVALCAAETDPEPGDVYLDDADDRAVRIKLIRDWISEAMVMADPVDIFDIDHSDEWAAMDSQKVRDAEKALEEAAKALSYAHPDERVVVP